MTIITCGRVEVLIGMRKETMKKVREYKKNFPGVRICHVGTGTGNGEEVITLVWMEEKEE